MGFLEEGDYSVPYNCQNVLDDPETDDELEFFGLTTVPVTAGANNV